MDKVLLFDERAFIPLELRQNVFDTVHIPGSNRHDTESRHWPGITPAIKFLRKHSSQGRCGEC